MLLSVRELAEESPENERWRQVCARLDEERLHKVQALSGLRQKAESAGGGLLVQHLLHHAEPDGEPRRSQAIRGDGTFVTCTFEEYTLQELLSGEEEPVPVRYAYGERGKPYLCDRDFFFSLSHSGDYVICAISPREVGADIQRMRTKGEQRLADRFFSAAERALLQSCVDQNQRQELFFRLWTRKEAYGKMTGEGIAAAIGKDFSSLEAEWMSGLVWEEAVVAGGYRIACCFQK